MKRDMELIRKVLLAVENMQPNSPIEGYSDEQVKYHRALVIEAGLVKGSILPDSETLSEIPASVVLDKLTWTGHDFVDAIASESNWHKVKNFLKDAGKQITIETVKFAVLQLFGTGSNG